MSLTRRDARAVRSLADSTLTLESSAPRKAIAEACERGHFRPTEEDELMQWFGHLLTLRDALWEVVADLASSLGANSIAGSLMLHLDPNPSDEERHAFLVGYSAACLIVRNDRLLVESVATHSLTQRKLNEGAVEWRIPRKQYTGIYESLSQPRTALLLRSAMSLAKRQKPWVAGLDQDPRFRPPGRQASLARKVARQKPKPLLRTPRRL